MVRGPLVVREGFRISSLNDKIQLFIIKKNQKKSNCANINFRMSGEGQSETKNECVSRQILKSNFDSDLRNANL